MSITQELIGRLLNGESLATDQVVREYGCTPGVLHQAIRQLSDSGRRVERVPLLQDNGRWIKLYSVVMTKPRSTAPTLRSRVERIERILDANGLSDKPSRPR